jgi:hypothetical protein
MVVLLASARKGHLSAGLIVSQAAPHWFPSTFAAHSRPLMYDLQTKCSSKLSCVCNEPDAQCVLLDCVGLSSRPFIAGM